MRIHICSVVLISPHNLVELSLYYTFSPQVLDYDTDPPTDELPPFTVEVRDPDSADTVTVKIFLTDVNDNAPEFVPDRINSTLSEDVGIGTSVATFTATDKDSGDNGDFV